MKKIGNRLMKEEVKVEDDTMTNNQKWTWENHIMRITKVKEWQSSNCINKAHKEPDENLNWSICRSGTRHGNTRNVAGVWKGVCAVLGVLVCW